MTIQAVLYGTLEGEIWWPQEVCQIDVTVNLTSERRKLLPNRGGSLRYMINRICHSGDFRSAKLTDDSYIKFTMTRSNSRRDVLTRCISIKRFKEIQDLVVSN